MSNKSAMILGLTALAGALTIVLGYFWVQRSDFDRIRSVLTRAANDPEYVKMALMMAGAEETLGKPCDRPALDKFFPNESPEKK